MNEGRCNILPNKISFRLIELVNYYPISVSVRKVLLLIKEKKSPTDSNLENVS